MAEASVLRPILSVFGTITPPKAAPKTERDFVAYRLCEIRKVPARKVVPDASTNRAKQAHDATV
jgi:hypothetical protein